MRSMVRWRGMYSARKWFNCLSRAVSERCRSRAFRKSRSGRACASWKLSCGSARSGWPRSREAANPLQIAVMGERLVAQLGGRGFEILVVEEVHLALQVVFLLVEGHDFEAPLAAGQDVHAAVGIHLQHLLHHHGAAGIHDAIVLGQHDAELGVLADGIAHHFLVALLENVQRQRRSGKDHHLQREQRDEPRRHGTIMAFRHSRAGSLNCTDIMRIDGKVVLITGASEGIGAACAAEFARAGARLSLTARSEEGLRRAAGREALVTAGDLTSEETRRRVVERTLERFGAIDILINNAGVGFYLPSWSAPMEEARRLMELNFFALLGMIQLVAPHMRARRSGTDRQRRLDRRQDGAALDDAVQRVEVCAGLADRGLAHGAAAR